MPRGAFDRSPRRAETRARLLESAARVYARRGFDGATVDEIAADAGLTKGAVYDHFGSKEKLLLALLDEHLSAQIAEQRALFDPSLQTAERPRVGADRWMRELEEDPDVFRLFVESWVHAQRDEEFRGRVVAGMEAWRQTLMGFAGSMGHEPSPEFATVMLALATGLALVKLADPGSVPPGLLGDAYVMMISAAEAAADRSQSRAASA